MFSAYIVVSVLTAAANVFSADPHQSIGGEKSLGNELAQQMKLVATDVTVVVLPNTDHWILEERPQETST